MDKRDLHKILEACAIACKRNFRERVILGKAIETHRFCHQTNLNTFIKVSRHEKKERKTGWRTNKKKAQLHLA
jgi:hypothetical protein